MGMRVIEPEHREAPDSRCPACVDVALGIEDKPVGVVGDIAHTDRFDDLNNLAWAADQHTAAFAGKRVVRMSADLVERRPRDANGYNASTTMAMPMPPPMQREATPYRRRLARSA